MAPIVIIIIILGNYLTIKKYSREFNFMKEFLKTNQILLNEIGDIKKISVNEYSIFSNDGIRKCFEVEYTVKGIYGKCDVKIKAVEILGELKIENSVAIKKGSRIDLLKEKTNE